MFEMALLQDQFKNIPQPLSGIALKLFGRVYYGADGTLQYDLVQPVPLGLGQLQESFVWSGDEPKKASMP